MDAQLYDSILAYNTTRVLPPAFPSSKSNFIALCGKFTVNGTNTLIRDAKIVLKSEDLDRTSDFLVIFHEFERCGMKLICIQASILLGRKLAGAIG